MLLGWTALPVAADWLVMRDGSRLETKEPWTVDGRRIIFQTQDGRLSSLRVDQVDLEASRRLTQAHETEGQAADGSATASDPAQTASRPPARRWTNEEIRRVGAGPALGPAPAATAAEGEAEAGEEPAADEEGTVVVRDWDTQTASDSGLVVRGVLINPTADRAAVAVRLTVVLFDEEGELAGRADAQVAPTTLLAGASGSFEAHFPDVRSYGAIRFDLASRPVSQGEPAVEPAAP